ncbi:MAG TPA: T9SS type A sorting domain-containing protein [Chitinophagaceae bacterium]|nr:T9SS type A sorting domain-containing protein [Chitinophagaceae bacterium]
MKIKVIVSVGLMLLIASGVLLYLNKSAADQELASESSEENEENEAAYQYLRWKYDADMIKDPTTGEALFGLRDQEIEFARKIPERNTSSGLARLTTQNNYLPAGPNNNGGRTRAIAYDVRYNGTTNKVLIAGGISGGIFRSTDGGANWTRVTPANEVHNVACVAQDPRPGNQDTWYAGGGEYVGNSADEIGAGYLSYGVLKSTDNGATWTRLSLTNIADFNGTGIAAGVPERFDHPFDYVHKITVNPVNGDVYIACHRRIVRSSNGGTTFQTVFGSAITAFAPNGLADVVISPTGKVYVAFSGAEPDLSLRGIWKSTNGDFNSYTRLAGGSTLGVDSVDGWRGNAYSYVLSGTEKFYDTRRTLLALASSNENILYVLYENGLTNTSSGRNKEADLFKLNMTSGNVWTNLSANLPDFPGGDHDATDPFTIQGGYDLFITVKPNDPNFVLIGGTSLYRSTDGFSTANYNNTLCWIGGYGNTLPSLTFYPTSHPDIHNVVFNPSNPNEAICSNDGGIQMTTNITAAGSSVVWTNINNYQTLQYYRVTIDPEIGANNFAGGAQDNGTQFRDKTGVLGLSAIDSNNHRRVIGGDGSSVGISKKNGNIQYLYAGVQLGSIRRAQIQPSLGVSTSGTEIRPNGLTPSSSGSTTEFGEFVTNFKLNPDNTEDLYYINFNRMFRTTSASTVTSSSWTELTGVSNAIDPSNGTSIGIRAVAFSRGNYGALHSMYFGTTNGKIFRLDDPRNAAAAAAPAEITPPTSVTDISGLNVQDIAVNPNNDNEILVVISNYGRTNATTGAFNNVTNILWTNNAKSAAPTWKIAEGNLIGTLGSSTNAPTGLISARSCMITVKKDGSGNPVTEYYAGTAAGLFAVENLGTTLLGGGSPTWQREGSTTLNYAVINSLAYRPDDNVLLVGTHGNGLYYTFLGTPNLVTGIINPIINDKEFITMVYPTISESIIQYRIGNKTDVKKISVQLFNMQGQEMYRQESGYQNGSLNISRYSKGAYILSIYSDNRKYRHVQKIIR